MRGTGTIAAAVLVAAAATSAGAGIADGPYRERPVVVRGGLLDDAPARGLTETNVAAYRWTGSGWVELPVQADGFFDQETCRFDGSQQRCFTENRPALDDAADPDAALDADDEVVFLAREVGDVRAPADAVPPAEVDDPVVRYDVQVVDPEGSSGWVHLFKRAGGGTATYGLRTYTTDLTAHPDGERLTPPEDSPLGCSGSVPNQITHFASDFYCAHFATRWSLDDLVFRDPANDCAGGDDFAGTRLGDPTYEYPGDLLDRFKGHEVRAGADPDDAVWGECSSMRGEKVGAVRYVRGVLGAKSGVTTTTYTYMYPRAIDVDTRLGVHPMPGIARLVDWNANAVGGRAYHRHDAGEPLTAAADADGANCGRTGGATCPAGTDGDFREYDPTDADSQRASTVDLLADGADLWDSLVTDRGRIHLYTRWVTDPTTFASYLRFLYADDADTPLNDATNWEEHRASIASAGVWFDLTRETYTNRVETRHAFQLFDAAAAGATDATHLADGEAWADTVRRPLTVVVSLSGGSGAPLPPAPPTNLRVRSP